MRRIALSLYSFGHNGCRDNVNVVANVVCFGVLCLQCFLILS